MKSVPPSIFIDWFGIFKCIGIYPQYYCVTNVTTGLWSCSVMKQHLLCKFRFWFWDCCAMTSGQGFILSQIFAVIHSSSCSASSALSFSLATIWIGKQFGHTGSPFELLVQAFQSVGGAHAHPMRLRKAKHGKTFWQIHFGPRSQLRVPYLPVLEGQIEKSQSGGPSAAWQGPDLKISKTEFRNTFRGLLFQWFGKLQNECCTTGAMATGCS